MRIYSLIWCAQLLEHKLTGHYENAEPVEQDLAGGTFKLNAANLESSFPVAE
jgi:hypothetical protein